MTYPTTCKFCQQPLSIEVDDSYPADEDPAKLLPLAACNRCADARVAKYTIEGKIRRVCAWWAAAGKKADPSGTRHTLTKLTQDYAKMICRWHDREGMAWDEEIVNLLMDKPEEWSAILGSMWRFYRQSVEAHNDQAQRPALGGK